MNRLLAVFVLAMACTPARGPAPPGALKLWTPPERCAFKSPRDDYGRPTREPSAVMVKDGDDLRELVECTDKDREPFAFDDEWLAIFTLVSKGGRFKPLGLRDDGTTLTLDVESYSYCGGTPPGTNVDTIAYRVPATSRKLSTNVTPAKQEPCPPDIP